MSLLTKIYNLLNKKEKYTFFLILFLTLLNTFVEILGITAIIPLISITLKQDLSLFENFFFYPYLLEFSKTENFIIISFSVVLAIFVFKNFYIIFYNWFFVKFYTFVGKRLADEICEHYINLNYIDYLKLKGSKFIYQCTEAIEMFKQSLYNLILFILEILVLFSITAFLIFLNPKISIMIIFFLTITSLIIFSFFVKKNKLWGKLAKKFWNLRIGLLNEILTSFKDIVIFNSKKFFFKKFQLTNYNVNLNQYKSMFLLSVPRPFLELVIVILLISSLYFLLTVLKLPPDQIILLLSIYGVSFFRIYPSMTRISQSLQKFNFGSSALDELKEVLAQKNINIKKIKEKRKVIINEKINSIKMIDLSFAYNQNNDFTIEKINVLFQKNILYGIVGSTGSGKSTLIDLISGLLKPSSGTFEINQKIYNNLGNEWYKKISYVTQNVSLINDTLEKNIAFGLEEHEIDKEKIKSIIDKTALTQLVDKFKERKDQIVGERGIQISGGEKQRIGIARALYFDRDIYIFDEATNALDKDTEKKILTNLKKILVDKILIFVTHKESTINYFDKILSLKNKKLEQV